MHADIVEYAEHWANQGKIVIIAALDGTFQRKAFNCILELIPLAEEVSTPCSIIPLLSPCYVVCVAICQVYAFIYHCEKCCNSRLT